MIGGLMNPGLRMTDMRGEALLTSAGRAHNPCKLRARSAFCPPPPVARALSNPSWKVIVSASRGQYLKPGSFEPGFFLAYDSTSGAGLLLSGARMHAVAPFPALTGAAPPIIFRA